MKKLKIAAAMILPLLAGLGLLLWLGGQPQQPLNIEPLFTLWLLLLPAAAGWVAGGQYPRHPLAAGLLAGLVLSLSLAALLVVFLPELAWPLLLLFLAACAILTAGIAAFAAAIWQRAQLLLAWERQAAATAESTAEEVSAGQ